MTRRPPGGVAPPAAQVEKYQPQMSGTTMNTTMRSGFIRAVRASRSCRTGEMNSSHDASLDDTYR